MACKLPKISQTPQAAQQNQSVNSSYSSALKSIVQERKQYFSILKNQ